MISGIEFEQKFVLDVRRADQLSGKLCILSLSPDHSITAIRQYYDKKGERFRASQIADTTIFVKEVKKSIKIGTEYSICTEDETEITEEEFEEGWKLNETRRLQKIRHTMPGRDHDHKVTVDFFYTKNQDYYVKLHPTSYIYAVIAEDEIILNLQTKKLSLDFQLPIYLEEYLLTKVDDSIPEMKIFKSANLVDQPENIEAVIKAIGNLYDPT